MKSNLLHICFILDESGSMHSSRGDVIGGFCNLIEEQKKTKDGECIISLYRFASRVKKDFIGKPIDSINIPIKYCPGGATAMNDGIGTAIDEIGVWLNNMDESKRPSKNMIVIMTDGAENNSKKYTLSEVKDRIKHQTEKYSWTFVYMGTDISNLDDADNLGIELRSVSDRDKVYSNYKKINSYACSYRCAKNAADISNSEIALKDTLNADTIEYSTAKNLFISIK